jgi:hypothetical protein
VVAIVVAGFSVLFAFIFTFSIKAFNFQKRWNTFKYDSLTNKSFLIQILGCHVLSSPSRMRKYKVHSYKLMWKIMFLLLYRMLFIYATT